MNKDEIKNDVKKYQEIRQNSTDFSELIQQSAVDFYQQLESCLTFLNRLPNKISYRKHSIQQVILDITQSVDSLQHELSLLNTDCGIQIHSLIITNKILNSKEERNNEKQSNSKMVRKSNLRRKPIDSKKRKKISNSKTGAIKRRKDERS